MEILGEHSVCEVVDPMCPGFESEGAVGFVHDRRVV